MKAKPTPQLDVIDVLDKATSKAMQLDALLLHTYGESADSFSNLNPETRDNYLWMASGMAAEIRELIGQLRPAHVVLQGVSE